MPRVWHCALVIRPRCEDRCSLETPSACPEASASLSRPSPCSRCCRSPALSSSVSSLVSHTAGAAESAGQVQVLAAVSGRFLLGPRGPPCWGGPLASWSRREPVSPSPGAVSIRRGRLCIYGEDHLLRVSIALARSVRRPTGSGRTLPGLAWPEFRSLPFAHGSRVSGHSGAGLSPSVCPSAVDPGRARAGPTSRLRVSSSQPGPSPRVGFVEPRCWSVSVRPALPRAVPPHVPSSLRFVTPVQLLGVGRGEEAQARAAPPVPPDAGPG